MQSEVTWKRSYIVNTKWTQAPIEDPVWCAGYHMHNERCIAVYQEWIVATLSRTALGVWNAKTGEFYVMVPHCFNLAFHSVSAVMNVVCESFAAVR